MSRTARCKNLKGIPNRLKAALRFVVRKAMRKVLCIECGFLCVKRAGNNPPGGVSEEREFTQELRDALTKGSLKSDGLFVVTRSGEGEAIKQMKCFRQVWERGLPIRQEDVTRPRKCRLYAHYEPNCSPERHIEFFVQQRMRREAWRDRIISGVIGAAATGLITWLVQSF